MVRRKADASAWRIRHLLDHPAFNLVWCDLEDQAGLIHLLQACKPHSVYNLAAQSYVPYSWQAPAATAQATALGVLNMLEAVRIVDPAIQFYQASSSEIFGQVREMPQTELTALHPRSPYGVSKAFGHWITVNYRESYGLFACSGILFNHESERRGIDFVTRKVTWSVARIKHGLQRELKLGNLEARRDWGYAPDYVEAMQRMLDAAVPDDYVIATGRQHSVKELCEAAFAAAGLQWADYVVVDEALLRPAEVATLLGDASKAHAKLGWKPTTSFEQMVEIMVRRDLERVEKGITWET
jgi:GDPmannose 4,6-dehydratase